MKILVCGASGFIGRAICERLTRAGHEVVRGVRVPVFSNDVAIDFRVDTAVEGWLPRVRGIDIVINAVGIITESHAARFEDVHFRAPTALFEACAKAGVQRIIQISSLGADTGDTAYFRSKRAADEVLMRLPVEWQILYPSLVYGQNGVSASMFRALASLPVIPVPALVGVEYRPIHIDDLTEAVESAISPATPPRQRIECVGASRINYKDMLDCYRQGMHLPPPRWLTIPAPLMALAAKIGTLIPGAKLTPETLRMLRQGNVGDTKHLSALLDRAPLAIDDFIAPDEAELLRHRAHAAWRLPLLRGALAVVWILTAFISLCVYPTSESLGLLNEVGLTGEMAKIALYGAALLDLSMGIACLARPSRALWAIQGALVLGYSIIIAVAMPRFLTHPFGPLLKNIPILAILFILLTE
ncbi:NAD-dependent dehydratase [Pandoraea anapnoica]|uniref:NAD-dependent dehydratase n=1 Tax=Pandoraea anapnoica TaxID=2508301 RepID=A0A5E5AR87_9BURK|nr:MULTISPECIES: SDR family oxidoreductase [Pandoraea]VVE59266.1 NAD-dependent dehydratase [Pandoraea iniqua]VVE75808.1 NAD-dependent dehydratase [Pandoraea anapnoica]